MRTRFAGFWEAMKIALPVLLLVAGGVWLALKMSDPAPPGIFVISTASNGSPYHRLGTRYTNLFARNGIKLEVRESDGSVANFKALTTPGSGVDAAFVQGGLISPKDASGVLRSAGSLMSRCGFSTPVTPSWSGFRTSRARGF